MICINNSVPECVKFWIVTRWEIQGCEVGEDIRHEIVLRRGETDRELVCEFHTPIINEKSGTRMRPCDRNPGVPRRLDFLLPGDLFFFVGNIEADLTHAVYVWKCISPIVILFYGCVPIIITIGLIILDTVI